MTYPSDAEISEIPGAFWPQDRLLVRELLEASAPLGGDLLEIGTSFGQSAVVIGGGLRPGETFTVIDLFGSEAPDSANAAETDQYYSGLSRAAFENNYRSLHGVLPRVIQAPSSVILDHTSPHTHRFIHVDASHLYEHVVKDIDNARALLKPDGIVVVDDFRQEHTPGVAAAAWQSVSDNGMVPFAITPQKMYATWGDAARWRAVVLEWATLTQQPHEVQVINGHETVRIWASEPEPVMSPHPRHPLKRYVPEALWPALARFRTWTGGSARFSR